MSPIVIEDYRCDGCGCVMLKKVVEDFGKPLILVGCPNTAGTCPNYGMVGMIRPQRALIPAEIWIQERAQGYVVSGSGAPPPQYGFTGFKPGKDNPNG